MPPNTENKAAPKTAKMALFCVRQERCARVRIVCSAVKKKALALRAEILSRQFVVSSQEKNNK